MGGKNKEIKRLTIFYDDTKNRIVLKELLITDLPITQRIISIRVSELQINEIIKKAYHIIIR